MDVYSSSDFSSESSDEELIQLLVQRLPFMDMEHHDTSSNASDSVSTTNLSGLTGYEDELQDLKRSLKLNPCDDRIKTLASELKAALITNERHQEAQRKAELAFHEKFDRLLKRNAELSKQNDRLVNTKSDDFVKIARENFELSSKITVLENELTYWKKQASNGNGTIRQLEEAKIDSATKNKTIENLKGNIVDLHVKIQNYNGNNIRTSNALIVVRNELESFKKSEAWYKEQLHESRGQKLKAFEELSGLQIEIIKKERELNLKNSELAMLRSCYDELQTNSFQQKKIEELKPSNDEQTRDYQTTIGKLTNELASIQNIVKKNQNDYAKHTSELLNENSILQRELREIQKILNKSEMETNNLQENLNLTTQQLGTVENLVKTITKEKSKTEIALSSAVREKREIEEVLTTIRDNFVKFAEKYKRMKDELVVQIDLQKRIGGLEAENAIQKEEIAKFAKLSIGSLNGTKQDDVLTILSWIVHNLLELDEESAQITVLTRPEHKNKSVADLLEKTHQLFIGILTKKSKAMKELRERSQAQQQLKKKMFKIKYGVLNRLKTLEDRCRLLREHQEDDCELLKSLKSDTKIEPESMLFEEIKQLKIQYKAKEVEKKEIQKRYEANNRTLLKKVKEHMRGRATAEKHCVKLQHSYENTLEELGALKTKFVNVQSDCISYKESIEDLTSQVQIANRQALLLHAELQRENESLTENVRSANGGLNQCKDDLAKLESRLEKERENVTESQEKLLEEQKEHEKSRLDFENSLENLRLTREEIKFYIDELELMKFKFTLVNNELNAAHLQHATSQEAWAVTALDMEKFKSEVRRLQSDLRSLRSEKYFYQKLCKDLKFALETTTNQSKILKRHIETLSSESRECSSLPDLMTNLPSPRQYDDARINDLLKRSGAGDKPLGDLENCLKLLKREMSSLRKQVSEYAVRE